MFYTCQTVSDVYKYIQGLCTFTNMIINCKWFDIVILKYGVAYVGFNYIFIIIVW